MLNEVIRLVRRGRNRRITRAEIEARTAFHFGRQSETYTDIMRACDTARDVHRGKKRRNGEPLINHERAVYLILLDYMQVRDRDLLVAAFLHDLVEDYDDWTLVIIVTRFGKGVAEIVGAVTKPERPKWMSDDEYSALVFEQVEKGGLKARLLKYADRLHNMVTLWGNKKKKAKKIRETMMFVLPMAILDDVLWVELMLAAAHQVQKLGLDRRMIMANVAT